MTQEWYNGLKDLLAEGITGAARFRDETTDSES
jgi:hypothetical protein